tara:strand:- start:112 stop:630 length:519 start_codon:yes stop_codon:yes gene_type:complete
VRARARALRYSVFNKRYLVICTALGMLNWCSICRCDLPTQRNGTVLKSTRAEHFRGQKHRNNHHRQTQEAVDKGRRVRATMERIEAERIDGARHALLLAVTAARLRAAHGSMDVARTVWAVEADTALNQLASPALKAALWSPAVAHVANRHVCSAASDAWLVVKLVIDVASA